MRRHISYNAASIFARANIIVPNLIFKFTNEEVMNVKSTYGEKGIYIDLQLMILLIILI